MEATDSRKFSAHRLNSHLTGECLWLSSLPLWHLGVWLLTWPGLKAFALTGPSFKYHDARGVVRTTAICASAVLKGDRLAYFTLAAEEEDTAAIEAQRAHARHLGAELFTFSLKQLYSNQMEVANRRDAHIFLYQAHGLRTSAWEAGVILQAHGGGRNLAQAARALGLTWEQTCVGFLKCWLEELVQWDIGAQPLNPYLPLRAAVH